MKALTLQQPWASLVAFGDKTIEFRSWQTEYRGPLLICAGSKPISDGEEIMPYGVVVALVQLVRIEPFTARHLEKANFDEMPDSPGFAWHLRHAREVHPIKVKGKQRLFELDIQAEIVDDQEDIDHYDLFHQLMAVPA
jgi:hypothetical protein